MLFKALSAAVYGIDAYLVEVEVDVSAGLGNFLTVGLPDMAVKESKERIKAAIKTAAWIIPFKTSPSIWRPRTSRRKVLVSICRWPSASSGQTALC